MVRARLPSIAKGLIKFGCCADTTVQMASRSRRFLPCIAGNSQPFRGGAHAPSGTLVESLDAS
jgi:hypothetical protein